MDLVSAIIPCYNVSSFVDKFSWIFEQTYPELEVVLVDDGSTDDTWQKLQSFKQQHADKRIVIAHNEINLGLAATRNRGIDLSSGQYLCFWDADDKAYPQFVEKMLAKLKQEQADFVYCAHNTLNHKGGGLFVGIHEEVLAAQHDINLLKQKVFYFHTSACTKMVRRDFIQEHGIKFPLFVLHEDNGWTIQLVLSAQKIAIINEPYYLYYISNPTSLMHQPKRREPGFWQTMHFYSDYMNKLGVVSLLYAEWNLYVVCYVLNKYSSIVPTGVGDQDRFFIKVRDFCRQNNVALTAKDLPIAYRFKVYLLLPNVGCFAEKRDKLKSAYLFGQELLPAMRKLFALIKSAEVQLKEDSTNDKYK